MILHIIGNGFDLSHNLETDYTNFMEFAKCHHPNVYQMVSDFHLVNSDWSNFEDAMGTFKNYSSILLPILEEFDESMYELDEDAPPIDLTEKDYYSNQIANRADQYLPNAIEIKIAFSNWIQTHRKITCDPKFALKSDDLYINFNYTPTLESVYKIPSERIIHPHGKCGEIVLVGHTSKFTESIIEKRFDDSYIYIGDEAYDRASIPALREIAGYLNSLNKYDDSERFYKKIKDFVAPFRSQIDEVEVFGCSMGQVDQKMFEEIMSFLLPCPWKISFFAELDDPNREKKRLEKESQIKNTFIGFSRDDVCLVFTE